MSCATVVFLNARDLDPVLGRFIAVDLILAVTGDAYGYGNNNPISYSDPSGLCCTVINGQLHCGGGQTVNLDGSGSSELVDVEGQEPTRVSYDSAGQVTGAT